MKLIHKDDYLTLYQGDCLDVMDNLIEQGVKFDAIITDIPYGTTSCTWDSVIPFDEMWGRINKLVKKKTPVILFGSQPFTSELIHSNIKNFKHEWIWEKSRSGSAITAKYRPVKIHEDIVVFCNESPNYYPIMEKGEPYSRKSKYKNENNHKYGISSNVETVNEGTRYPKTIRFVKQNWSKQQQLHPTQKPVELIEYLIESYTKPGDLILDFTCGSGTTLLAAKNLDRRCIGIELEEKYCEVAKTRFQGI